MLTPLKGLFLTTPLATSDDNGIRTPLETDYVVLPSAQIRLVYALRVDDFGEE